jgi:hypothetical protein
MEGLELLVRQLMPEMVTVKVISVCWLSGLWFLYTGDSRVVVSAQYSRRSYVASVSMSVLRHIPQHRRALHLNWPSENPSPIGAQQAVIPRWFKVESMGGDDGLGQRGDFVSAPKNITTGDLSFVMRAVFSVLARRESDDKINLRARPIGLYLI